MGVYLDAQAKIWLAVVRLFLLCNGLLGLSIPSETGQKFIIVVYVNLIAMPDRDRFIVQPYVTPTKLSLT